MIMVMKTTRMALESTYRAEFLVKTGVRLAGQERTVKACDMIPGAVVVVCHQVGQVGIPAQVT